MSVFEAFDIVETFMKRWKAGQAATALTLSRVVGRELTADDVEPLTWALAEAGKQESAAEYLVAVDTHQLMSRMTAGGI